MSLVVITLKILIMTDNHASCHTFKKISPRYLVCVIGGLPESKFAALAPFPFLPSSMDINTQSTLTSVLPVAGFPAARKTLTPGMWETWLLTFERVRLVLS